MVGPTSLRSLLEQVHQPVLGLDAYGVIYNNSGPFSTMPAVFDYCRDHAIPIVMMTNNAKQSIDIIYKKMVDFGLAIPRDHIISSACGLNDVPELKKQVTNRSVFVYGYQSTHPYVMDAGGHCVSNPDDADIIVLASSLKTDNDQMYDRVVSSIHRHPHRPIICVNPDQYVRCHTGELCPVMGFYAQKMSQQLDSSKVIWMGKPMPLFSKLVQIRLAQLRLPLKSLIFCDDNPLNVHQIVTDLGCWGAVISSTGVFSQYADDYRSHPNIVKWPRCEL